MGNLNKVLLMGNLTKDPEVRYSGAGLAIAALRMAINSVYKSQAGEKKEEVCYMTVKVFGKVAENCGQYLTKGSPILVEGRLKNNDWTTKEGEKKYSIEVLASNVQFLGKGKAGAAPGEAAVPAGDPEGASAPPEGAEGEEVPF